MVTGDPNQAVHPEGDPSGLQYLLEGLQSPRLHVGKLPMGTTPG